MGEAVTQDGYVTNNEKRVNCTKAHVRGKRVLNYVTTESEDVCGMILFL